ncbi:MAG: hypothetical protein M1821_003107 [Bathelium mastoideum]|nr:MAG: hypothetical protein M1821_003107 [Bathelium mastoideum]
MSERRTNANLEPLPLPSGITERQVDCYDTAGLSFHILEAGYDSSKQKPLVLLIHGFPEIAFSWRKVMLPIAAAGYYVVAVDQRGYGRTVGWDNSPYDKVDMTQFTITNLVRDFVILVHALGYHQVKCVVGHDFGAVPAAMGALMRGDMFTSCVVMSHPHNPPGSLPFNTAHTDSSNSASEPPKVQESKDIQADLARLPNPRKHYKYHNSTPSAAQEWDSPPQGLATLLRGYIHLKSAAWPANTPHPLAGWTAEALAEMPEYYIMPLQGSMGDVVARLMAAEPDERARASRAWLSDADLAVYAGEWQRTGFQGGLNWYRSGTDARLNRDLALFAGRKIEVPCVFVSGAADWGNYQQPGALEAMLEGRSCADCRGFRKVQGAGHWPQQEQPEKVVEEILKFLGEV